MSDMESTPESVENDETSPVPDAERGKTLLTIIAEELAGMMGDLISGVIPKVTIPSDAERNETISHMREHFKEVGFKRWYAADSVAHLLAMTVLFQRGDMEWDLYGKVLHLNVCDLLSMIDGLETPGTFRKELLELHLWLKTGEWSEDTSRDFIAEFMERLAVVRNAYMN